MLIVIVALITFILGGIAGVILMCFVQVESLKEYDEFKISIRTVLDLVDSEIKASRKIKNIEYIKGMCEVKEIFKDAFKEELK